MEISTREEGQQNYTNKEWKRVMKMNCWFNTVNHCHSTSKIEKKEKSIIYTNLKKYTYYKQIKSL